MAVSATTAGPLEHFRMTTETKQHVYFQVHTCDAAGNRIGILAGYHKTLNEAKKAASHHVGTGGVSSCKIVRTVVGVVAEVRA